MMTPHDAPRMTTPHDAVRAKPRQRLRDVVEAQANFFYSQLSDIFYSHLSDKLDYSGSFRSAIDQAKHTLIERSERDLLEIEKAEALEDLAKVERSLKRETMTMVLRLATTAFRAYQ